MFLFQGSYHSDISTKCVRLCSQPSATPSPGVDNQLLLFRETGQKVREVSQLLFQGMEVELQTRRLSSQWPQFKTVSQHLLQSHLENHLEQNVGNDFSLRSTTHTRLLSWLRLLWLVKVELHTKPRSASPQRMQTFFFFCLLAWHRTEVEWSQMLMPCFCDSGSSLKHLDFFWGDLWTISSRVCGDKEQEVMISPICSRRDLNLYFSSQTKCFFFFVLKPTQTMSTAMPQHKISN